ncbi:MAG: hypothetical protein ABH837_03180 [bacterium]
MSFIVIVVFSLLVAVIVKILVYTVHEDIQMARKLGEAITSQDYESAERILLLEEGGYISSPTQMDVPYFTSGAIYSFMKKDAYGCGDFLLYSVSFEEVEPIWSTPSGYYRVKMSVTKENVNFEDDWLLQPYLDLVEKIIPSSFILSTGM